MIRGLVLIFYIYLFIFCVDIVSHGVEKPETIEVPSFLPPTLPVGKPTVDEPLDYQAGVLLLFTNVQLVT